jgi:hypothetical protein
MEALKKLAAAGWTFKLMVDQQDGVRIRVWLSRRKGDPPHREESTTTATVKEAVDWLRDTADLWYEKPPE